MSKIKIVFIIAAVCFINASYVYSQKPAADEVNELGSGRINSIVSDSKGNLYASAEESGIYKFSISEGRWRKIFTDKTREHLLVAVNQSDHLFVAIPNLGLMRSLDGGKTFEAIGQGLESKSIKSITADRQNNIFFSAGDNYVYKSTDNGYSFQKVFSVSYLLNNTLAINSKGYLYVAANYYESIFRSTDKGETWTEITDTLVNGSFIKSMGFDSKDRLYLCTETKGILRYDENDKNLRQINTGIKGAWIETICFDKAGNIYAGSGDKGIYKSTDEGNSWQQIKNKTRLLSSAVDGKGDLYFGDFDMGVIKISGNSTEPVSFNNGLNAIKITDIGFDGEDIFVTLNSDIMYRYNRKESKWKCIPLERGMIGVGPRSIRILNGIIYTGAELGFYVTDKNRIEEPESDYKVSRLSVSNICLLNNEIFMAGYGGLMKYNPVTDSVESVALRDKPIFNMTVSSKNILYLIHAIEKNIYYSTDGCKTVTPMVMPALSAALNGLEVDSYDNIYAIVGTTGILHSPDNGITWQTISTGYSEAISASFVDKNNNFLLGYKDGALFRTSDKGKSWVKLDASVINSEITVIKQDIDGTIYIGTYDKGLYKLKEETLDINRIAELPREPFLKQNYPNPFNPKTTIHYEIHNPSMVRISIHDMSGKEIETPVNSYHRPGSYFFDWNPKNLSTGVYYYNLSASGINIVKKMMYLK